MLTLSRAAVEAVDGLLHTSEAPEDAGLRIRPAGESQLTIEIAPEPAPGDQVIQDGGARVFVDAERVAELRALGRSWPQISRELRVGVGTAYRVHQEYSRHLSARFAPSQAAD